MMAGITEILIISTPHDLPNFQKLLWDGNNLWCRFEYIEQKVPNGLAQAFVLWEKFVWNDNVVLILWDNIFYWAGLQWIIKECKRPEWGIVFAYHVSDPQRYGVVEFDKNNNAISIEEKPLNPKSNYAVPWLYFYDNSVIEIAKNLKPGTRWEYELTDINKIYLQQWKLKVSVLPRWTAWLDTGTFNSLIQASEFVQVIQERQWFMVGCIEEIAYREWFINKEQLKKLAEPLIKSGYGEYLMKL
jgi:glucose-1-phosphate thymidylyltransferase